MNMFFKSSPCPGRLDHFRRRDAKISASMQQLSSWWSRVKNPPAAVLHIAKVQVWLEHAYISPTRIYIDTTS